MFCLFFITACFIDCRKPLEFLLTYVYIKPVFQIGFVSVSFPLFVNFKVCTNWVMNIKHEYQTWIFRSPKLVLRQVIGTPVFPRKKNPKTKSNIFLMSKWIVKKVDNMSPQDSSKFIYLFSTFYLYVTQSLSQLFPKRLYKHDSPSKLFITLHHIWSL